MFWIVKFPMLSFCSFCFKAVVHKFNSVHKNNHGTYSKKRKKKLILDLSAHRVWLFRPTQGSAFLNNLSCWFWCWRWPMYQTRNIMGFQFFFSIYNISFCSLPGGSLAKIQSGNKGRISHIFVVTGATEQIVGIRPWEDQNLIRRLVSKTKK